MKRLNEASLKNLIRKLRQTGATRDPKMTRGRQCARVEVGDIVTSKIFARGYRDGDVTVIGNAAGGAGAKTIFNPNRARASYVVEDVREETVGASGQLVRARRLARDGSYDPRGEIIVFRQPEENQTRKTAAVLVIGKIKPATGQMTA